MALSSQASATIINLAGQWAFDSASKVTDDSNSDQWEIEFELQFVRYCDLILRSLKKQHEFQEFWKQ